MKIQTRILSLILSVLLVLLCAESVGAEGILPVLQTPAPEETTAISLDSTTGVDFKSLDQAEGGGYKYNYSNVSYACYTRFSLKLAEEGYILVSSEMLEDGTSRAVVTNGTVTLVMDYNLENKTASVSYPPNVYAREPVLYDDYTEVTEGDEISLTDHVTARIVGWNWSHRFYTQKNEKESISDIESNYVFFRFDVDYFRPEKIGYGDLIPNPVIRYDGQEVQYVTQGKLADGNPAYKVNDYASKYGFEGKLDGVAYVLVFKLTKEQLLHPEKVTVTFTDYDRAVRYVYKLKASLTNEAATGVWYGKATSSEEGAEPYELRLEIWPDGSSYTAFRDEAGSAADSWYTTSSTALDWENGTVYVYVSNSGWKDARGTFEFTDSGLTMDFTLTKNDKSNTSYTYKAVFTKDN